MTFSTVIADDEALARQILREFLADFPEIKIVAECVDGDDCVEQVRKLKPDLLFLDVQMPGRSGFEVLPELEELPHIIFCTAYDQFALEAFEVNALDYLLKPLSRERLATAIKRLPEKSEAELDRLAHLLQRANQPHEHPEYIFVREGRRIHRVDLSTVHYIMAEGDYCCLYTANGKRLSSTGIGELESHLDPRHFLRVHRSTMVAVSQLAELLSDGDGGYRARLQCGAVIKVSRSYAGAIRKLVL